MEQQNLIQLVCICHDSLMMVFPRCKDVSLSPVLFLSTLAFPVVEMKSLFQG